MIYYLSRCFEIFSKALGFSENGSYIICFYHLPLYHCCDIIVRMINIDTSKNY